MSRDYRKKHIGLDVNFRSCRFISLIIFFIVFGCAHTFSQGNVSTFQPVAPDFLSNSSVRCLFKDSDGYMWIGTEDALIRYDGINAHRYLHNPLDHTSVPHNTINAITESNDRHLYIGTAQGLCIYNRELDSFVNVDSIKGIENYLNNRYITDLEFDEDGNLWIGTHEGGINIFDPVRKRFDYITEPPHRGILPSSNFINTLTNLNNTIWCSTKGGLLLFDARSKRRIPLASLERFSNAQISSIVLEKPGHVLLSTLQGDITRVILLNGKYSFQQVLEGSVLGDSPNKILTLAVDASGSILAGGENSGLNIIDNRRSKITRVLAEDGNTKHLPTNSVQSVYTDKDGLIWIGTSNNGVFLLDKRRKKFEKADMPDFPLAVKEVRSFAEDSEKNIWIACYGAGLAKMPIGKSTIEFTDAINDKLTNKNITSIISDRQGDLWVGTAGNGVFRVNPNNYQVINYALASDGFGNNQVFCVYEDKRGTIWAGTWGSGLFYFDKKARQFINATDYDKPNHIPNTAYVTDILEDYDGTFWVGTLYGLYELSRDKRNSFTYRLHLPDSREEKINGSQIQAIVEDYNKDLWVGTAEGLNLKKKGQREFIVYQVNNGNQSNALRSILLDDHGNVWMGGNKGLSKFDVKSESFVTYTKDDGLRSNNFHRKAALRSSNGRFYFGSQNGFDDFFPDSIQTNSAQAKIVLSDLKINNQSVRPGTMNSPLVEHISLTSELVLAFDQRSFVIDFVALDFGRSANYTYCYKLEGFDEDWICKGRVNSATYTNIDPGNYVFIVKAANPDGAWIEDQVMLEITIQQVFWKTWWAISIYVTALSLLLYFLIKIRIERIKLKNEVRFEKLTREQEHRLSESKTQFFTNVAHEFRTPLSLISIPLESLMGTNDIPASLRERIYTAFKNASRMTRLVNELLDFNKLEGGNLKLNVQHGDVMHFIFETSFAFNEMATKRAITFSISSDHENLNGWFDKDKLERMLFNLLSNAFKFTADGGEIKVKICTTEVEIAEIGISRCIKLVIEDSGIGILPEELPHIFEKFYQAKSSSMVSGQGTGIGLSYTKALIELHSGTITAESVPDYGTIFTIVLPIDGKVYQVKENSSTPSDVLDLPRRADNAISDVEPVYSDEDKGNFRSTILVVEDNPELREYLIRELSIEFDVLEAKDGAEGQAMARDRNPDLIISDITMPVKNGIELCLAIKTDISTSHIPFILLTARGTIEDQITGVNTGADLYISKPFNIRYLVAHVRQIITTRRKLYSRFSQDVYLMPGNATTNNLDQEFLQKAIDYIMNNLQDSQLSVDSIAALFNLSRMQAYRKIKALTGKSVVEFVRMVRMKQAIKLMDSTNRTLAEIAFEVGFNSASYFTRCFKEEYGKTPSEYLELK